MIYGPFYGRMAVESTEKVLIMSIPTNLFIVRHGESIGNLAKRMSERGDHSLIERLRMTHTAHWPLTKTGIKQAEATGRFLNSLTCDQGLYFDRMYVSPYARALETASRLCLTKANWIVENRITERDWGDFDRYTEEERHKQFEDVLRMREVEPFFWSPPGGQPFNRFYDRIKSFVVSLARIEAPNVVVVCHGEVAKAFRMVFAQMAPWEYADMEFSKNPLDRIHNCQVDHYSRRNPESGHMEDRLEWLRVYRPSTSGEEPVIGWRHLPRKRYDNHELFQAASRLSAQFADIKT